MNIKEFTRRFHKLRDRGFIPSRRRGPTGVGKTLEDELGIEENNIALSDLPFAELKAHRIGSTSMITLFTFNNSMWHIHDVHAFKKHATIDENGRMGIYFVMGGTPNSAGLYLIFESDSINLRHKDGSVIASLDIDELLSRFRERYPAILLVSAEIEGTPRKETYHFVRSQLLSEVSKSGLRQQFREGKMLFDVRLYEGQRGQQSRTGLRASDRALAQLFERVQEL